MDVEQRARELLAAELDNFWAQRLDEGLGFNVTTREAMDAIIAALTPQWQPIEMAPKDTVTEILAWDGYDMRVTRWCFPYKGHPGAWYESEDRYETLFWEPTHWQPLPAQPKHSLGVSNV